MKTNIEYLGLRCIGGTLSSGLQSVMRPVTKQEHALVAETSEKEIGLWIPTVQFDKKGPQYRRNALSARKIDYVTDLFTRRNLYSLALLWNAIASIADERLRSACQFTFTAIVTRSSWLNRRRPSGAGDPQTGTIYISSLTREENIWRLFEGRFTRQMQSLISVRRYARCVTNSSACLLSTIPGASIDYVFTDPPFGSNIYYSEPNLIWEAWLGKFTDATDEAVVHRKNDGGTKRLPDYARLMRAAFNEIFRVLKPGRWATVEFNNSDGSVFEAIKTAVRDAGFEIVNMLLLDKKQKTFKQVKGAEGVEDVVDKDVLFNLYKPAAVRREIRNEDGDLEQQVAEAVRQHLASLPERMTAEPAKYSDDHRTTATINSMLMNALIPRGVSVERLNLPFIERVCSRFFRKIGQRWYLRGEAVGGKDGELVTAETAVSDELSAIAWLRQKVQAEPKLIGELKPLWMKATGLLPAALSEALVLEHLLLENFWRDSATNRWREPTAEEREKINDDRSLRVLHDAERLADGRLDRTPTSGELCDWIRVLFETCKELEEDPNAQASHLGFDKSDAYRLIVSLSHHLTSDGVEPAVLNAAKKQSALAGRRLAEAQDGPQATAPTKRIKDDKQGRLDLFS